MNKHNLILHTCPICGNIFSGHYNKKYCSIKCSNTVLKQYRKKHYKKNKQKILKKCKIYYNKNKKNILKREKKYREKNKEKIKKYRLLYYSKRENKDKRNTYLRTRRKNDVLFKLNYYLQGRLYEMCKDNNFQRSKRLNLNTLEIKTHLENQFDEKMNWNNYGSYWSIDHKIPLSWFDNIDDAINIGWNINNFQPMIRVDNEQKKKHWYGYVNKQKFFIKDKFKAIKLFKKIYNISDVI